MRKTGIEQPFHALWSVWILLGLWTAGCSVEQDAAPVKAFEPGQLWLDSSGIPINAHGGGILTHNDKYYWFGQHMVEGRKGNKAQVGVHCYSSDDLYNWKDEGIALRVSEDPDSEIARGCILERPKVIFNETTHKFVIWFHLELKGMGYLAARSGVATSDS
ncbi:MAG: beta-glucanase, partial [bacterium]